MNIPRIVISAAHRSSGKTTLSIGLCAALAQKGLAVQPFKKGPDYIDPMWLSAAAGRECRNLDFFLMGEEAVSQAFQGAAREADLALVEGNAGLYDSVDLEGRGSTASLARLLKAPVILVVDATGMTRGVAPLILGYQRFEPDMAIAGVILNRVHGSRHEAKLRAAVERYCGVEVLGALPTLPEIGITERHLGLIPVKEDSLLLSTIEPLGRLVRSHVNLDRVLEVARTVDPLPDSTPDPRPSPATAGLGSAVAGRPVQKVTLGVAMDSAFTFYYPENLQALREAGAALVPFSPLSDAHLPSVQGLFIGGGFPEVFMEALERNTRLRQEIREAVEEGMPVYAECGGLMYMARSITWNGKCCEMVGAIPCDVRMTHRPVGHGYVTLQGMASDHWSNLAPPACGRQAAGREVRGHEFHHSRVVNLGDVGFAFKVLRGHGVDGRHDGILYKNVLATYTHLHSRGLPQWAERFVGFVKAKATSNTPIFIPPKP